MPVDVSREEFQQANRDQLDAINSLATEIRGLAQSVIKQRSPPGMSMTNMLILMGAVVSIGAFLFDGQSGDIDKLAHAMVRDDEREHLDAGRMARHQTGIEVNAGNICILWRKNFPTLPCPEAVQQPPIP